MNKTSTHIRESLRRYYPGQEYSLVHEVARATGFSANRHLDCVVMSLWPSRGLHLSGIEIKVNKYDWKKEKADPTKAEEIAQFLDYFYIAAPTGLIPIEELPEAWGLIEVNDQGKAYQKKAAVKTPSVPITHAFMAAMLRAATRSMTKDEMEEKLDSERSRLRNDNDRRVKEQAEKIAYRGNEDAKHWQSLITALGEDPDRFYDNGELIAAIKAVKKAGITKVWGGLETLRNTLQEHSKSLNAVFKDLCLEEKHTKVK